jgi:aryl-alcohol dehydrogenase-like predicted oxidoreductase
VKRDIADISKIGLGCSRMGSIGAVNGGDPGDLIREASASGINVFDTADIYGQGRSERILGGAPWDAHGAPFIITKAGQYFPAHMLALKPAKALVRQLVRRSKFFRSAVSSARAGALPTDFSPARMTRCFAASTRRLAPLTVDVFLLHGPRAETVVQTPLQQALGALVESGQVGRVGVSCEDVETAEAAVKGGFYQALEVPLSVVDRRFVDIAREARSRGLLVIAREVLGGLRPAGSPLLAEMDVVDRVAAPIEGGWADIALVGTTNIDRLVVLAGHLQARGILRPAR